VAVSCLAGVWELEEPCQVVEVVPSDQVVEEEEELLAQGVEEVVVQASGLSSGMVDQLAAVTAFVALDHFDYPELQ